MYEAFFSLSGPPFPALPSADRYCPTGPSARSLEILTRVIRRGEGPALLIGPPGIGKSAVLHVLQQRLEEEFQVLRLSQNRVASRRDFLQQLLFELGLPYNLGEDGELRIALRQFLNSTERCPHGLVLLIDDADGLQEPMYDELLMLSDLARRGNPLVRVVLAGGVPLEETLSLPGLVSFQQRVAARCYLEALGREETANYVCHRFVDMGGDPAIFSPEALRALHEESGGVPRLINQITNQMLVIAARRQQRNLGVDEVLEAWSELQHLPASRSQRGQPAPQQVLVEFGQLDDEDQVETAVVGPAEVIDEVNDEAVYEDHGETFDEAHNESIGEDHGEPIDEDRGAINDDDRGAKSDDDHGAISDEEHGATNDEDHGATNDDDHGAKSDDDHGAISDDDRSAPAEDLSAAILAPTTTPMAAATAAAESETSGPEGSLDTAQRRLALAQAVESEIDEATELEEADASDALTLAAAADALGPGAATEPWNPGHDMSHGELCEDPFGLFESEEIIIDRFSSLDLGQTIVGGYVTSTERHPAGPWLGGRALRSLESAADSATSKTELWPLRYNEDSEAHARADSCRPLWPPQASFARLPGSELDDELDEASEVRQSWPQSLLEPASAIDYEREEVLESEQTPTEDWAPPMHPREFRSFDGQEPNPEEALVEHRTEFFDGARDDRDMIVVEDDQKIDDDLAVERYRALLEKMRRM